MTYTVTTGRESVTTARAKSIEHAANVAARKAHGRTARAIRTTGTPGLSGYFQAYVPWREGGETSIGAPFHVGGGQ